MKFARGLRSSQGASHHVRRGFLQLLRYAGVLLGVMVVFAILFQVIMVYVEGERHSWVTAQV